MQQGIWMELELGESESEWRCQLEGHEIVVLLKEVGTEGDQTGVVLDLLGVVDVHTVEAHLEPADQGHTPLEGAEKGLALQANK